MSDNSSASFQTWLEKFTAALGTLVLHFHCSLSRLLLKSWPARGFRSVITPRKTPLPNRQGPAPHRQRHKKNLTVPQTLPTALNPISLLSFKKGEGSTVYVFFCYRILRLGSQIKVSPSPPFLARSPHPSTKPSHTKPNKKSDDTSGSHRQTVHYLPKVLTKHHTHSHTSEYIPLLTLSALHLPEVLS